MRRRRRRKKKDCSLFIIHLQFSFAPSDSATPPTPTTIQQNWSDTPKLCGDETISQCSHFNFTPRGKYCFEPLLFISWTSCPLYPATVRPCLSAPCTSCPHRCPPPAGIDIPTLRSWVKCIRRRPPPLPRWHLLEMASITKYLLKEQNAMNHSHGALLPRNILGFSVSGTSPMIRAHFLIYLRCSPCAQRATNYSPRWIRAVLILYTHKKQNCKDLYGGTLPGTLGGEWSPPPSPTYPDQIPSGRSHFGGKDLSLLIMAPASHRRHRRWIIPVNLYPRRGEAMFVYIDPQHMWHSCCRQRRALAEGLFALIPWQRYSWQAG